MGTFSGFWITVFQTLFIGCFMLGSGLLWFTLLRQIRFGRASRLAFMLERVRHKDWSFSHTEKREESIGVKERAFNEKARLAGLPVTWTYHRHRYFRIAVAFLMAVIVVFPKITYTQPIAPLWSSWISFLIQMVLFAFIGWWMPGLIVFVLASRNRTQYLLEIAKLSQRLSVCVNEKTDIREILTRAGRPLKLLKPHLQELTVWWGKDQREAIWRFKEAVGISEVFPLVNSLEAVRRADAREVSKVLKEQTAGIEATLSAEINRKIENAPIWISFYIMIPFGMIVTLFLYPWLVTISKQLMTSFQG